MITDAELKRALSIAGLRVESGGGGLFGTDDARPLQLEARESGYHEGMTPDDTWDAQMMLDWLDDQLKTDIYYVSTTFARAQALLERMKTENPERHVFFTASGTWGRSITGCAASWRR